MRRLGRFVATVGLVGVATASARPVTLDDVQTRINITPTTHVATLPAAAEDVHAVRESAFAPLGTPTVNRGLDDTVMWLRFELRSDSPSDGILEITNPRLRHVDLYVDDGSALVKVASTGTSVPHANRPIPDRNLLLPVHVDDAATYYVRVENRGSLRFRLELWRPDAYYTAARWRAMALGLFYGLLIAMAAYHLFLYGWLRDPMYMYFVLLIATYVVFQASLCGLAQQVLWPQATWWADRSVLFFNGLSMFFALAFSNQFLELDARLGRGFAFFAALMVLSLFVSAGSFLPSLHANLLAHVMGIVGPAALFAAAAYLWRQGHPSAWIFLLGWTAALAGTLMFALVGIGVLPENAVTANGLHAGFAAALLLFSLALAQRVSLIERAHRQRLVALNGQLERELAHSASEIAVRGEQLKTLATRLTHAERAARRQLAQALHDHLQQLLVAAQYRLAQIERRALPASQREAIEEADAMVREGIAAARDLAIELSPPAVHRAGLTSALEWLGQRMLARHDLRVDLAVDPQIDALEEDQSALMFEVARELLFNVVKHAGTRSAKVTVLRGAAGWLRIVVEDNGVGFDAAVLDAPGGPQSFGLAQIAERLSCLGGRLRVHSERNRGTRIEVEAPVAPVKP